MKNFLLVLFIALSSLCLTSCAVSTYAYSADDYVLESREMSYNTIVRYGVPFYVNDVLSYYLYDGIYYYPYVYNSVEYFKPFRTVQPRGFVFVPGRHRIPDYRFRRHPYRKPHFHNNTINRRPIHQSKPQHRTRTINPNRSSIRKTTNHRNHNMRPQIRQHNGRR